MQAGQIKEIFNTLDTTKERFGDTRFVDTTIKGVPLWPLLRNLIYSNVFSLTPSPKPSAIAITKKLLNRKSWNLRPKQSDYILFTDSNELIEIEKGIYVDKISQNIIDALNKKLLIIINSINGFNGVIKNNQNYLDASYFHRQRRLSAFQLNKAQANKVIHNVNFCMKMLAASKSLNIDGQKSKLYLNEIEWFFIYYKIFDTWLNKVKPKAIFINCGYSLFHQALIYTCNMKKIQTIELQHGLISDGHIQYSPAGNIGKETFPRHLLTFSDYHSKFVNKNFIDRSSIYPVGHYYREEKIKEKNVACKKMVSDLRKKYKKIILVASQDIIEKELNDAINKIAKIRADYCFIFKQRNASKIYFKHDNVIVDDKHSIYDFINLVDINLSCFSTSILEFISNKTIGVLMDFSNLASNYYSTIKKDCNNIFICNNTQEALSALDKKHCNYKNPEFYKDQNKRNVETFLFNSLK